MPDSQVRDAIRAQYQDEVRTLSDQLSSGDIDLNQWHEGMKQALRDSYALNLRAGSDSPLKYTEYLKLGTPLKKQYGFLQGFKADIASGAVTGGAIASRAALYVLSAIQMYWRQVTKGIPVLDHYPGDGQTPCLTNCLCELRIDDLGDGDFDVYWELDHGDVEHCDGCEELAAEWKPLQIRDGVIETTGEA